MNVLFADKTGTLTVNRLSFTGALPQPGFSEDDVLSNGALASEEANQDPIDLAFLRAAQERRLPLGQWKTLSFVPFSPENRRTEALIQNDTGTARVTKGALVHVAKAAGLDSAAIRDLEARVMEKVRKGYRVLAVARGDGDEPLHLTGIAFLYDAPRPDSRQLINELRSLGVTVKMLTGDALPVARELAREFGLGEVAPASDLRSVVPSLTEGPDGFAEVFPEDKFLAVKTLQDANYVVGMTGDGVNDAPALRQAEVGIAVSNASDVAKAAASVALTVEGLVGIIELVKNGRAIYQRVLTWIINKVSRTILKSGFVVIAFLATGQFVISALGMVLLVFMTDFVKIALSTDHVRPSPKPETWNIRPLVTLAVVMGLLMLAEALGLLAIGWRWFELGGAGGRLQTFSFQTLLFFALFSIVSIRERRAFWYSRTSTPLAIALIADACAGTLIGILGMGELQPLPLNQIILIVIYALFSTLVINDFVKTRLLSRQGSSNISQEGSAV
jgi:magnesium-transporting ATPase (P-type)